MTLVLAEYLRKTEMIIIFSFGEMSNVTDCVVVFIKKTAQLRTLIFIEQSKLGS